MSTVAPGPVPHWDRLSWNARRRAVSNLNRIEQRLKADIEARTNELANLEAKIRQAKGELLEVEPFIDLRLGNPFQKVIWGDDDLWSQQELLNAHAAYTRGDRDEWAIAGHRIWDKKRKRKPRTNTRPRSNAA